MKTVFFASIVSFLLIFSGTFLWVQRQAKDALVDVPGSPLRPGDVDAAELSFAALEHERAQLASERQRLLQLRGSVETRELGLTNQRAEIERVIAELQAEQQRFGEARSASAQRLAKMFDSMKPDRAAIIFKTLDRRTSLEILAHMKEKTAAKLLSALDPALAADLSTRLSLRGAR